MRAALRMPIAGLLLGFVTFGQATTPVTDDEVTTAITAYGDALSQGDISGLRQLVGGALLDKRAGLWTNPDYPQLLIDSYGSSSFTVRDITPDRNGNTVVEVAVEVDGATLLKLITVARLPNGLKIIDERMTGD